VLTWAVTAVLLAATPASVRHDGHRVVRVYPTDEAALAQVLELADDVWSERPRPGRVDIEVGPEALAALDATGLAYDVLVADVQLAIDEERERLAAAPAPTQDTWYTDFRTFAEIDAQLDVLADAQPGFTEVFTVGQSLEGRTVRGVKLGRPAEGKAALLLTGTMHAREWLSPMTVMCIADHLLSDSDLLETIDVYVIPVLNPDGYVYSWQGDRYWRKNTRGGYGVDLNRNFGYEWGGAGASPNPSDENYHGDGPFSEPETQILRDFVDERPELVAHIDFHSYAELVIYPWGYGYESAPDEPQLSSLASAMAGALNAAHGHAFQPIQGADFYPAAGAVDDWAYGDAGMMAFTIELRGNDFVIAPSNIVPSCEESLAGTLELAAWTAEQSDVVEPPDGGSTSGDGGGGSTNGDDGGGPPAESDGDEAGVGNEASDGGGDGEDGGGNGDPGEADPWLPAGYGMGPAAGSCACRSGEPEHAGWVFFLWLVWRRRTGNGERAGTGTGTGTESSVPLDYGTKYGDSGSGNPGTTSSTSTARPSMAPMSSVAGSSDTRKPRAGWVWCVRARAKPDAYRNTTATTAASAK
jgi:hypothetical protein